MVDNEIDLPEICRRMAELSSVDLQEVKASVRPSEGVGVEPGFTATVTGLVCPKCGSGWSCSSHGRTLEESVDQALPVAMLDMLYCVAHCKPDHRCDTGP